jgi:hypothetical protein
VVGIRFLVYLTTLGYAAIIIYQGPSTEASEILPGVITSPLLGAIVGITQVIASLIGIVSEFVPKMRPAIQWVFLVLSAAFIYEFVLQVLIGRSSFDWIPHLVYGAVSVVVFLNEGVHK